MIYPLVEARNQVVCNVHFLLLLCDSLPFIKKYMAKLRTSLVICLLFSFMAIRIFRGIVYHTWFFLFTYLLNTCSLEHSWLSYVSHKYHFGNRDSWISRFYFRPAPRGSGVYACFLARSLYKRKRSRSFQIWEKQTILQKRNLYSDSLRMVRVSNI